MRTLPGLFRKPRERFHTEQFEDSIRVPVMPQQLPGVSAVPGFFGRLELKSSGLLVAATDANGRKHWGIMPR